MSTFNKNFNWFAALLILIAAVLSCSYPPQTPPTSDYYVSVKGDDASGNGSQSKPWRHIQYAINHVNPQAGSVPQINLLKGIYEENLVIKKPLILKGAGAGQVTTSPSDPLTPLQDISLIQRADANLPSLLIENATSVNLQDLVVWGGGVRAVNTRFIAHHIEVQYSQGLYGIQLEKCSLFYIEDSKIMTSAGLYSDLGLDLQGSEGEINNSYLGDLFDHVINIIPTGPGEKINPYESFTPPHVTIRNVEIAGSNIYYADGVRIQGPTFVFIENSKITRTHADNEPAGTGVSHNPPYAAIEVGGWITIGPPTYVKVDGVTASGFDVGIGTAQEGFGLFVQNSSFSGVTHAAETYYNGYTNVEQPHVDFGGGYYGSVGKNSFSPVEEYGFYNDAPYDVDACYNNWNVDASQIDPQRIYDKLDNGSKGRVKWQCPLADMILPTKPERKVANPTPTSTGRTVTVHNDDLCYAGPGPRYEVVSAVKSGQVLALVGRGEASAYFVVVNPVYGDQCWVRTSSVKFEGNPDELRIIVIPPTSTVTPRPVPEVPTPRR